MYNLRKSKLVVTYRLQVKTGELIQEDIEAV